MKKSTLQQLSLFLYFFTSSCMGLPQIIVSPSNEIEVGEEVQFTIPLNISIKEQDTALYEWDFGDGYYMKRGFPSYSYAYSGPTCIHFFMKPGKFSVKLFRTMGNKKDSSQILINVRGESPIPGYELWHAPFHARIGQYIYVKIPSDVTRNQTNKLIVLLTGSNGYSKILINKSSLENEEKVLLKNSELPKGNYTLLAELFRPDGRKISYIMEKFNKSYDGIPTVGINENNAICINGKPTFLVTGFLLSKNSLNGWAKNCINTTIGEGYYPSHTVDTWIDYLTFSKSLGRFVIGPDRWIGKGESHYERNSHINAIEEYVNATKNQSALLMWNWDDEPNLGGRYNMLPPPVLASWTYSCHKIDPNHPVWVNLYGYGYLTYYKEKGSNGNDFDYLGNDSIYGGKKHFPVDFIGFDIYPLEYCEHVSLQNRRVMEEFALVYDRLRERNYDLIPISGYVECQEVKKLNTPAPTPKQILMEAWISVVHGAKMISWFNFFGERPEENVKVMDHFASQMAKFGTIILSAPSKRSISDDANVPGKRVDFIARDTVIYHSGQSDTCTYIFAVRVTEPEGSNLYVKVDEPDTVTTTFTLSGFNGNKVYDIENKRWIQKVNNTFSDKFEKCAQRVFIISKNGFAGETPSKATFFKSITNSKLIKIPLNPFDKVIDVPMDAIPNIKVYNLNGVVVGKMNPNSSTIIWADNLNTGMYLISDNKMFNLKISLIK